MSFDAMRWALAQDVPKSTAKFLLVAMADCVNGEGVEQMVCWPSVAYLAQVTAQDRKTVMTGLKALMQLGLIEDTEDNQGGTKQIRKFRLKPPAQGGDNGASLQPKKEANFVETVPKLDSFSAPETVPNFPMNSTEFGTVEESQKRDCLEGETVPFFPSNSTVFPDKQYQFSLETVPKTGYGTRKEPGKEPGMEPGSSKRTRAPTAGVSEIPGVPAALLADYLVVRKSKKAGVLTQTALNGLTREAEKAGLTVAQAIEFCCEAGWQGFNARWYVERTGGVQGGMPGRQMNRQEALETRNRTVAAAWAAEDPRATPGSAKRGFDPHRGFDQRKYEEAPDGQYPE